MSGTTSERRSRRPQAVKQAQPPSGVSLPNMRSIVFGATALCFFSLPSCSEAPRQPIQPSAGAIAALQSIAPSGSYPVGARDVSTNELPIWLFYPASDVSAGAAYPPPSADFEDALSRRFGAAAAATLSAAHGHARWGAGPSKGSFPVVIFAPGAGVGSRAYLRLIEDLASHGYVVATIHPQVSPRANDARYRSAAQEFRLAASALERASRIEPWQGALDLSRMALVGHSLGGAAAVRALALVPEAAAAANLDGDFGGVTRQNARSRPILYVVGCDDRGGERTRQRRRHDWQVVADGNTDAMAIALPGIRHFGFSDVVLVPSHLIEREVRLDRIGTANGRYAYDATRLILLAFLDESLRGEAAVLSEAVRPLPACDVPAL